MVSATFTAQAFQTTKSSRRPNRANSLSKTDLDLASSGGAASDQGHSKQQPPAEVKAYCSIPADRPLGGVDATSAPADVSPLARSSTPTAFAAAADKQENPKRWHNVLGPLSQGTGSSMAPGRRQQQQQQPPSHQAAGQAQDKTQSSRPLQAVAATGASSGKNALAGSSVPQSSSGPDQSAAQQGVQYQGKPLRVTRTVSNSSNEAGTPVHGSQRGAAGKQPQQPQAEATTTDNSSTGPKSAPLSYAAAAVHRQPQPVSAPAPARVKKSAPAPAAAVMQEPFPPLAATSKPSADGWAAGPGNPPAASSGWGSSSTGSSKTWGPKHAEAHANGKADLATNQAADATSAARAISGVPATQSKPARTSGVSKDEATAHKQASSTAGRGSGAPSAAAGPSRQDSYGSQPGSGRAGDGGSRRGGFGGDFSRSRRSSSNSSSQWAPKQPQADASAGAHMQQPSDQWARNAAAYTGEVASKQMAGKLPATQAQQAEGHPAQQGSKGASSSSSGGKEAAVSHKASSAPLQPDSDVEPARRAADKGLTPAATTAQSSSSSSSKTSEAFTVATVPALQQDAGITAASAAAAQQAAAAAVKSKAEPVGPAAARASAEAPAAAAVMASAALPSTATSRHGVSVTPSASTAQPAPVAQQQAPNAGINGTGAMANVTGSQFGPPEGSLGSSIAPPAQGSSLPPKADVLLTGKAIKQQQHSPAVKLPSSQAVNMAAVAARGNGSDDRFGAHSYGGVDSFGVSAGYPAAVGAPNYQPSMPATSGLGNFMPLYQQPVSTQLPSTVGAVDFLLSSANTSSAFREATYVPPDAAVTSQAYSGMPGPQAPAGSSLHSAAGGPSSTGSRNGGGGGGGGGAAAAAPQRGALITIKRNLSADAQPFEVTARTSSSGNPSSGNGNGSAGTGSGSSSTDGASGSGRAAPGATQRGGGKTASRAAAAGSDGNSQGRWSRQLRELAEQMQQDELAREAEHAEAARKHADLQSRLQTEKAARLAAEARVSGLEQELGASHQRNKDLEQQLTLESNMVARLEADLKAQAGEVEGASNRAAEAEAELYSTKQQLKDAHARIHSLQQQCQALEAEKLQLEHRISTQGAHAARVVADAAVAAAAAAIPGASTQHLHSSTMLHGVGLVGAHGHGGIATRAPPPGFDPVPLHNQHGGQQVSQLPAPGSPSAASGSTAAGPQGDMGLRGQAAAGPPEKNEHQLVLTFLSCLPTDPNMALRFTDAEAVTVNVQLMPLTWDENYAVKYGSMQKFMTDRPMVFGVREDGAFYKYSNSEQLVQQKMAQEAEQAAAAAAAAAPAASGPQPAVPDSSNQRGSFAPQQQQQTASVGGWQGQFQPQQQQQLPAPQGPGQHSMHSGPPSGPGLNIHAMSMPMGPPAGMGPAGMHHPHGPVPPHMGASMGLATMGLPYYPHAMMHSMPASMPLAGPSMPFPSGPHREQGW